MVWENTHGTGNSGYLWEGGKKFRAGNDCQKHLALPVFKVSCKCNSVHDKKFLRYESHQGCAVLLLIVKSLNHLNIQQ